MLRAFLVDHPPKKNGGFIVQENKPVYIVSGYMRSGTSMMMKCLGAGGLPVVYNEAKDKILNKKYVRGDYQPNPEGFFELVPKEFENPNFPQIYSGKLIKMLHWRLGKLPQFNYRIIFMLRDPKEIEVSYLKMFQRRPPFVLYKYDELIDKIFSQLSERNDIDVLKIDHKDVINDPLKVFSFLKENAWPIENVKNAVSAVNLSLYRSKSSDLSKVRKSIPGLRVDLPDVLRKG